MLVACGAVAARAGDSEAASGALDPFGKSDLIQTARLAYKCNDVTPSSQVSIAGGSIRNMTDEAGHKLAYDLQVASLVSSAADGAGAPAGGKTVVLTGTITPADFQNVWAGSYAEAVTLNVTP
jgi:hypothetical protein